MVLTVHAVKLVQKIGNSRFDDRPHEYHHWVVAFEHESVTQPVRYYEAWIDREHRYPISTQVC